MSISADHLRALHDGGLNIDECIVVARAMERGPDYQEIAYAFDLMAKTGIEPDKISKAILTLAQTLLERAQEELRGYFSRDEHTGKRDSNASRRGLPKDVWQALRSATFERDGFLCTYCGSGVDLTCDHVVPLVRGGTNDLENLTTACRPCNSSKGAKLVEEWLGL